MPSPSTSTRLACLLAALVVVVGCGISPKPEPPSVDPTPPVLDPSQVVATEPTDGPPEPTIVGGPGAVNPAVGLVRATRLNDTSDPVDATILEDGSFELWLDLFPGDEVRLQILGEETRSEPFDFIVGAGASSPLPAPRPLGDCFTLSPRASLDLARGHVVHVANQCAFDVTIESPQLRRPTPGWSAGADRNWPVTLAPGSDFDLVVVAPAGVGEEVVFVQASSPLQDRRPITVYRDAQ